MKNGIRDYLNPLLLYDTSLSSDKLNHAEKKKILLMKNLFRVQMVGYSVFPCSMYRVEKIKDIFPIFAKTIVYV